MDMVLNVIGWILWAGAALFGLGVLASRSRDGGVRYMMQLQGLTLLVSCALTAFLPLSKFWLLLIIPVSYVLPMVIMQLRAKGAMNKFQSMQLESERTGVPLADLVRAETERMQAVAKE
jgi:hypothetical protein